MEKEGDRVPKTEPEKPQVVQMKLDFNDTNKQENPSNNLLGLTEDDLNRLDQKDKKDPWWKNH